MWQAKYLLVEVVFVGWAVAAHAARDLYRFGSVGGGWAHVAANAAITIGGEYYQQFGVDKILSGAKGRLSPESKKNLLLAGGFLLNSVGCVVTMLMRVHEVPMANWLIAGVGTAGMIAYKLVAKKWAKAPAKPCKDHLRPTTSGRGSSEAE